MEYGVCGGGVGVSCRGVDVTMSLEMELLICLVLSTCMHHTLVCYICIHT